MAPACNGRAAPAWRPPHASGPRVGALAVGCLLWLYALAKLGQDLSHAFAGGASTSRRPISSASPSSPRVWAPSSALALRAGGGDFDLVAQKLEEATEKIRAATKGLEVLKVELLDRNMLSGEIDREFIIQVLALFRPATAAPMRPLLDKTLDQVFPALQGFDTLAALTVGMAVARLPHASAWLAAGDATMRLCSSTAASAEELSQLAWAFASAGERRPGLFDALRGALAKVSGSSLSEDRRRIFAWACAEVGEPAEEFGEPPTHADATASRGILGALGELAAGGAGVEALATEPLPVVAVFDVVSEAEAAELIGLADAASLWRSSSRRGARDAKGDDAKRTSYSAILSTPKCRANPVVQSVRSKVATILKVPEGYVEALQLVRYNKGEQYGPHVDWGRPRDASFWLGGQRTTTALIYLNTLPEGCGGETVFGRLGLRVVPRAGTAVLWPNVDAEGAPQQSVEHEAMPILCDATKYVVNVWVRGHELPPYVLPPQ